MKKVSIAIVLVVVTATIFILTMGLLDGFWNKRSHRESHNVLISHDEDWTSYLARMEGDLTGSIVVDLGLKLIAPVKQRPIRVAVDVTFASPRESGLPGDSEFDRLADIEESLRKDLVTQVGAIHVDTSTLQEPALCIFMSPTKPRLR
jgi:hypothetical protein